MHFHRCVVLRLSIFGGKLCSPIQADGQLRFISFSGFRQPDGVIARNEARSAATGKGNLRGRRDPWGFLTHAPSYTVQTRPFARRNFINDASGRIENFDLQFSKKMTRPLIVSDDGGVRRIVTDEYLVAISPVS